MNHNFRLLMLSAMYENGGNMTHRFLDGHPQAFVYPFESQLGTRIVNDRLTSVFPVKYRWPMFQLDASPEDDYQAIIDEECKVRSRTPEVSKFRHFPFAFSDNERREAYRQRMAKTGRSRANAVAAFFQATFDVWHDYQHTGAEEVYIGYSPIVVVDTEKIFKDFPRAQVVHVVRNPWSAYADTKKRPVPLTLEDYMLGWTLNQYHALLFQKQFPGRVHILRAEDVMAKPHEALSPVCEACGLEPHASLSSPSWNGKGLDEIAPWGTIRVPTPDANRRTAAELSPQECEAVQTRAWQYLEVFDYKGFW